MKFQEINQAPVNEGVIGRGVAAAQQLGSKLTGDDLSQLSVTDRHAMNIFIKDFLKKVSPALGIAVNSKIVDPTIVDTPSTGGGGAIRPTGAPVSALGQQAKQQMLAQRAANAASGNGRKPTAPAPVPPAPPAPTTRRTAEPSIPAFDYNPPDELFSTRREPKVGSLSESQYQKLNSIFESMLTEAKSIPAFIKDFLHTNVPQLNTADPAIAKALDKLINQVQTDWTKDKGKSALTKLAQSAYLLAKLPSSSGSTSNTSASGQPAAGQGAATQGGAQGGAKAGTQAAPEIAQYTQNILSQINRMQRNDADDLDAIIINSLRRLSKINNTAYMDTVNHIKTMIQSGTSPTPAQGSPNLVIARESKNKGKK